MFCLGVSENGGFIYTLAYDNSLWKIRLRTC